MTSQPRRHGPKMNFQWPRKWWERLPCRQSIALLQLRNPAGRYHSYFIPGKDYLSGPWEMYWSVFLFPPSNHLTKAPRRRVNEWCRVCLLQHGGFQCPPMGGEVMRKRHRDNAVINSVWTSSLCMQGSPPCAPGHRSLGSVLFFFGPFLVSRVCSCCVVCSRDRKTCKRGSLVPADKCMLRVTGVQLTLGFKSDTVWSGRSPSMRSNLVRSSSSPAPVNVALINTFDIISCFRGSWTYL